jgi:hypothetical protein
MTGRPVREPRTGLPGFGGRGIALSSSNHPEG